MTTAAKQLTDKQRRVVNFLAEGHTVPEIAKALKITTSGVYGHMRNIRKAGVKLPAERTNSGAPESNGHSDEALVFNGQPVDVDVPTVIRSQMEQVKAAMHDIELEATEMAERAKALHERKEQLAETVKRHEQALGAYAS